MNWNQAVLALVVSASCYVGLSGAENDAPKVATPLPAAPGQAIKGVDVSRVMGVRACLGCHGAETLSWMKSTHHNSHLLLRAPNAKKYAEELGIDPAEVRKSQACIRCHATGQADHHGDVRASTGVSCESCHGAAGGDEGWLNAHAVYGPNGTSFDDESGEHRKWRLERTQKAGMVQASQIYDMAKKCLECHLVEDEALVNAGHKIGKSFEFLGQTTGELLHNFHEDQNVNSKGPTLWARRTGGKFNVRDRKKFVVGLLTEIETALLAFSKVEDESDYSGSLVERAAGGWEFLAEVGEELEDDFPEQLAEFVELLEEIEDLDASDEDSRKQAAEWARVAGKLAREYASGDGASLEVVDDVLGDFVEPVGEVFKRN
jgi:hypothetical protein